MFGIRFPFVIRAAIVLLAALLAMPSVPGFGDGKQLPPAKQRAKVPGELGVIFDVPLKDTGSIREFQPVGSGSLEVKIGQHTVFHAGTARVRPAPTGTQAEIVADMGFPVLEKDGDASESRLGFVFANGQVGWVAFARQREKDRTTAELRVLRRIEEPETDKAEENLLRTVTLEEDFAAGEWKLNVRSGALVVEHKGKQVGAGCFDTHYAPIMGVVLKQEKGQGILKRLTLRGTEFPKPLPADKAELLRQASALNEEGKTFYRQKKHEEAAAKTKAGLELYRKVHGDGHPDVSNSLYNVAVVLRGGGHEGEAVPFFEEAIKLRQKLLGEDHPDTGLLEMELSATLMQQDKLEAAFPHALRAHAAFLKYYGPEHSITVTARKSLDVLPRPKPPKS